MEGQIRVGVINERKVAIGAANRFLAQPLTFIRKYTFALLDAWANGSRLLNAVTTIHDGGAAFPIKSVID